MSLGITFHAYDAVVSVLLLAKFMLYISNGMRIQKCPFTPKVLEAIFQAFLKFGQVIVDAMFVQKISNFW
jgi:hypothetical protein